MELFESRNDRTFPLPLPSLRLLVPPFRLLSACMWHVAKYRKVSHYSKLEEFVTLVAEAVPSLLSCHRSAELILRLKTKHACSGEPGPYDAEWQNLIWDILTEVDGLCQTPDLEQTASWLGAAPHAVDICLQPLDNSEDLRNLLRCNNQFKPSTSMHDSLDGPPSKPPIPKETAFLDQEQDTPSVHCHTTSSHTEDLEAAAAISTPPLAEDSHDHYNDDNDDNNDGDSDSDTHSNPAIAQIQCSVGLAAVTNGEMASMDEGRWAVETFSPDSPCEEAGRVQREDLSLGPLKDCTRVGEQVSDHDQVLQRDAVDNDTDLQCKNPVMLPASAAVCSSTRVARGRSAKTVRKKASAVNIVDWVSQIMGKGVSLPALPPLPPGSVVKKVKLTRARCNKEVGATSRAKSDKKAVHKDGAAQRTKVVPKQHARLVLKRDKKEVNVTRRPKKVPEPHVCSECGKVFPTKSRLETHERSHADVRPFECPECGRHFSCLGYLARHRRTHAGEKPFKCAVCGKGFTQPGYRKIHQEGHVDQHLFSCSHCPKTFATAFKLRMHERYHVTPRPYQCQQCGRSFIAASMLRRHRGYHEGERKFLCSVCGRRFVYAPDLKRHLLGHERPPEPASCPVCGKVLSDKYALGLHARTHTGERPHRCGECGRTFAYRENLKRHARLHTGERPYPCQVCGKAFKHSSNLREHERCHTGEKPYGCQRCAAAFRTSSLLKAHQRSHTGEVARRRKAPATDKARKENSRNTL
ncbi:zinc finger protein 324A-like [Sardina pilchardus]|uniref:zinc finger protein 324A-like n=1 Tax=Sardina pilchardus TaxID=27697 RepID=UPI002E0EC17C